MKPIIIPFVYNNQNSTPTILYQNIRSIKNKYHLLEALVEEYNVTALCLTETWITYYKKDLLVLRGYNVASAFYRNNHEAGGVCILLKDNIDYKECSEIDSLSIEFIFEICAIEIPIFNLILIVIYWPENNRQTNIFLHPARKTLTVH